MIWNLLLRLRGIVGRLLSWRKGVCLLKAHWMTSNGTRPLLSLIWGVDVLFLLARASVDGLFSCRSIGTAPVRGGTYFLCCCKESRQRKQLFHPKCLTPAAAQAIDLMARQ